MIAVFLESGELQRLYTGLSLLVSAAADGRPARALVGFGALAPLLDERLLARALRPEAAPDVSDAGREAFARTLAELRDTALALEDCRVWACAAAVEATGADRALVEARLRRRAVDAAVPARGGRRRPGGGVRRVAVALAALARRRLRDGVAGPVRGRRAAATTGPRTSRWWSTTAAA